MTRILNILLLIAIIGGIVLSVKRTSKLGALQAEHDRLAAQYGALDVKDPTKFLITRIETDDPQHFMWRCYYPAELKVNERTGFRSANLGGSTTYSNSGEYLHRVRFDLRSDHVRVHHAGRGGGGQLYALNAREVNFLKDHWNDLEFQVLASEGTVEVDPSEPLEFLTIRIPKDLMPEFQKRVGRRTSNKRKNKPYFTMVYGTNEAMFAYDKRQALAPQ